MAPGASSTPTSAHSESRDTYFIIDFIETVISVDSKSQAKPYEGEALTIARKLSITLRSSFVVATTLQPLESRVTCEFAGTEIVFIQPYSECSWGKTCTTTARPRARTGPPDGTSIHTTIHKIRTERA